MKAVYIFAAVVLWFAMPLAAADTAAYSAALHHALQRTNAVAVVLDVRTGNLLAVENADRAAMGLAAPGSVLKPFYLQTALEAGVVQPAVQVHCSRTLHIAGHTLNCGHPPEPSELDARQALAYSCNTYFATLAAHLSTEQIAATLHRYNIGDASHLFANEARGQIVLPQSVEQRQLFVLGVSGVRVSVAQVASAYRRLALEHRNHEDSAVDAALWQGLQDSVRYGTSNSAATAGLETAGKTGTAADVDFSRTHGWFVGIAPADAPRIVVAIFLPSGTGGDAAALAHKFYLAAFNSLQRAGQ